MKIKKIEIASFGKFKNFTMSFDGGFNAVFGKNEDGKSTIMAFICLMLYGNAGTASRTDLTGNFRKKYLPWSGEKMAGDMEIEHQGKNYLIHKEFNASSKTDKVSVTDIETGEKLSLPPDTEIGKYFLGIDYTGFEKTMFSANSKSFAGEESGDISKRLSNLSKSGDENISQKEVRERIESAMDDLVKKRSKGRLTLLKEKCEELAEKIRLAREKENRRTSLMEDYKKIEGEIGLLQKQAEKGRKSLQNEEKRIKATACETLIGLYEDAENKEKELEIILRGEDAAPVIKKGEDLKQAYLVSMEKLREMEVPEETNIVSEEDMKKYFALKEEIHQNRAKTKGRGKLLLIAIWAFAVLGAFFTARVLDTVLVPFASVLSLAGIITTVLLIKGKSNNKAEEKLDGFINSKGCQTAQEFEKAYRRGIEVVAKQEMYSQAENELQRKKETFISYISNYKESPTEKEATAFLDNIKALYNEKLQCADKARDYAQTYGLQKENKESLASLLKELRESVVEETEIINVEEVEKEIREKNAGLLEIKGQLGTDGENIESLQKELEENLEKEKEMSSYYKSLSLAGEVLKEAEDEMRRFFAPKLNERASEILSLLTGGKYEKLSTDKTYEIEVKAPDTIGYRNWQYLSRGTMAQSYLSLRIALCEMLSEKEEIPLFLDDVLNEYDEEREEKTLAFLEDYAKAGHQIIMFGCRPFKSFEEEQIKKINQY